MKKIYLIIALFYLCLFKEQVFSQCTPAISGTLSFCAGGSTILSVTTTYNSYSWSTGATTQAITVSSAGTYTVTVNTGAGCIDSASVTTNVNANPSPFISGNLSFCIGNSTTLDAGAGYASYNWSNGQTTQAISVNSTGTFTVTVTDTNTCTGISPSVITKTNPFPTATMTPVNDSVCKDDAPPIVIFKGLNGTKPYTFKYKKNGGPDSTITTTINSDSVIITVTTTTPGTVVYQLISVSDSNNCVQTVSGISIITIVPPPVIIISGFPTFCPGSSTTLKAGTHSAYLWSNGATADSIIVSSAGVYTVTVTDFGCTASASIKIKAKNLNVSIINTDTTFCAGSNEQIYTSTTGGNGIYSYLWTGAGAAYLDSTTISDPIFNSNVPGIYNVTFTVTSPGCTVSDSISFIVNNAPIASISEEDSSGIAISDSTICSGDKIKLYSSPNGATYFWNNGKTTKNITEFPSSDTFYTVTVSIGSCTSTASVPITVRPIPLPIIFEQDNSGIKINDSIICAGDIVTLTASGGTYYKWSNGATTTQIIVSPNASQSYTVTVTSADSCNATASIPIIVKTLPSPSIFEQDNSGVKNNDSIICFGDNIILTASGGLYYKWSNGSITAQITVAPDSSQSYTVTVTSADSCNATTSIPITVKPLPLASIQEQDVSGIANNDSTICVGGNVTLIASGGVYYKWSNGATTAQITDAPTASKSYTVTVTNSDSCNTTASIPIIVKSLPSPTIFEQDNSGIKNNDSIICFGDIVTLTASGGTYYKWSNGATTAQIIASPNASQSYTVTVTSVDSCDAVSSILISVKTAPSPSIFEQDNSGLKNNDSIICFGDNVTLTASGGIYYEWSNGATTAQITVTPAASQSYTVTVTSADSCNASASIPIIVKTLPLSSIFEQDNSGVKNNDSIICFGDNVTLTASGGIYYKWSNGATNAQITITPIASQSYTVTVTNSDSCNASTSIPVIVNPLPLPLILEQDFSGIANNDSTICVGDIVTLTASGGTYYKWSNGATTDQIIDTPNVSQLYTVTVTSADSCDATTLILVTVKPLPSPLIQEQDASGSANNDSVICFGDNAVLTASGGGIGDAFLWSNGATTAVITVSDSLSTIYTVTITNLDGCTETRSIQIIVKSKINATIIGNDTVCQNDPQPIITFQGYYGTPPYTFTYKVNGASPPSTITTSPGNDTVNLNIQTNIATNYLYTLISVIDSYSCSQDVLSSADSSSATILINPAPAKPIIASLVKNNDTVCAGSTNISFYVKNIVAGYAFSWKITGDVSLRDSIGANTVISFGVNTASPVTIIVEVKDNSTLCSNSDTLILHIKTSSNEIEERSIILKQPGNLLVYPDNSMDKGNGYQWGYDSIESKINNDTILGPPHDIPGQVYQFFIPGFKFLRDSSGYQVLNDTLYCFWVLLKNGECQSKVYYNGPYKYNPRPLPIEVDSTVALTVFPNPTTGDMNILLKGKIYGSVDAKIYNALGQIVYKARFEKKQHTATQNINLSKISEGVYLLELISSDHQKLTTRIIVYH